MISIYKIVAMITSAICTAINSILIVIILQARNPRSAINILIAHWSIVTCLVSGFGIFDFGQEERFIHGPWTCRILPFLRNWITNLYPLSLLAIIAEIRWQLQARFGGLIVIWILAFAWIVSGVGASYAMFMTTFTGAVVGGEVGERCVQIPMRENTFMTIIDTLRAGVFLCLAPGYVLVVLFVYYDKLQKFKMQQVSTLGRNAMDKKLRRVGHFGIYCVGLIFVWIPLGMGLAWNRILLEEVTPINESNEDDSWTLRGLIAGGGLALYYVYVAVGPVLAMRIEDSLLKERFLDLFRIVGTVLPPLAQQEENMELGQIQG